MKNEKLSLYNYVISLMETDDYLDWHYYDCKKQQIVLYYFKESKKWGFCERLTDPRCSSPRPWVEMKDRIYDFLKTADPNFEREFLRKKTDLDFIEQKPSKILEAL